MNGLDVGLDILDESILQDLVSCDSIPLHSCSIHKHAPITSSRLALEPGGCSGNLVPEHILPPNFGSLPQGKPTTFNPLSQHLIFQHSSAQIPFIITLNIDKHINIPNPRIVGYFNLT